MSRKPEHEDDLTYKQIPYGRALIRSGEFRISTPFAPCGDQAAAIMKAVREEGERRRIQVGGDDAVAAA